MRSSYKILVRECQGKRPSGRPRHRWEESIKLDLRELEHESVIWICDLGGIHCLDFCEYSNEFSGSTKSVSIITKAGYIPMEIKNTFKYLA